MESPPLSLPPPTSSSPSQRPWDYMQLGQNSMQLLGGGCALEGRFQDSPRPILPKENMGTGVGGGGSTSPVMLIFGEQVQPNSWLGGQSCASCPLKHISFQFRWNPIYLFSLAFSAGSRCLIQHHTSLCLPSKGFINLDFILLTSLHCPIIHI